MLIETGGLLLVQLPSQRVYLKFIVEDVAAGYCSLIDIVIIIDKLTSRK